ncbi:MAG: hypothetical protein ACYTG4_11145, partial [Planctomycetota bacterium]
DVPLGSDTPTVVPAQMNVEIPPVAPDLVDTLPLPTVHVRRATDAPARPHAPPEHHLPLRI